MAEALHLVLCSCVTQQIHHLTPQLELCQQAVQWSCQLCPPFSLSAPNTNSICPQKLCITYTAGRVWERREEREGMLMGVEV